LQIIRLQQQSRMSHLHRPLTLLLNKIISRISKYCLGKEEEET
jgi:hypothetical protein